MKIENQVCSLEQAKKLKELGVSPESTFYWHFGVISKTWIIINSKASNITINDYPAYTVAELGVMLPIESYTQRLAEYGQWEWINEGNKSGWAGYNTESEARGEMLIIHLQKRKITVDEVNKRLN